jgi:hypothetical protein
MKAYVAAAGGDALRARKALGPLFLIAPVSRILFRLRLHALHGSQTLKRCGTIRCSWRVSRRGPPIDQLRVWKQYGKCI